MLRAAGTGVGAANGAASKRTKRRRLMLVTLNKKSHGLRVSQLDCCWEVASSGFYFRYFSFSSLGLRREAEIQVFVFLLD
jgi:hypothetical protein